VDNKTVDAKVKKIDSFWQLRPLVVSLNTRFAKYYTPTQHISVDEITTPQKGRHRAKQYNKDKPDKWLYS